MSAYLNNIEWLHPWMLSLLVVPVLVYLFRRKKRKSYQIAMRIPSLPAEPLPKNWRMEMAALPVWLNYLAMVLIIIGLARPRKILKEENIKAEGIDIMLVTDVSSSMLAQDFKPNRLEASKYIASEFIDKRPYDRFGLVVFAGESYTVSPLTTDHAVLKQLLAQIQPGILQDGTAIGMGLAAAVNRIKDSKAKSKVVILLTDGVNNMGYIKPEAAAEIAKELGVKVYTIGVGTRGRAKAPIGRRPDGSFVFGYSRVEIDERLLNFISNLTHGKYFRATSEKELKQIYDVIDKLEKTKMEINVFKRNLEYFYPLVLVAVGLLLWSRLMAWSVFNIKP